MRVTELREEMFSNPYCCYFEALFSQSLFFLGYFGDLACFSLVLNIGSIIMRGFQEFDDDQE
jgi:hypothetical protein